ncbi:MAG: S-methyl-5'-thioadenosine phosphorylase [Bacteroidales bacterium]|jgi:5'-methylthioadenosine phosphorylase|nr:S-methyl-5'-thioadenosine phosphorylase [Bacteroidales bacterium]
MKKVAIIGGSGFEDPDLLKEPTPILLNTPYGEPSSDFLSGQINGVDVILVSRHGINHTITPSHVNNRANIYAIKELECTHILATTACGSLRKEIKPGELVFPDQFIDFTRFRQNTFFGEFNPGELSHTSMPDPFNKELRNLLSKEAAKLGINSHPEGCVITIEGPRFSTRAESKMFRSWGADIINMSTAPEAILANEIGIPYAAIAMSTDYDSWMENEKPVTWEAVLEIFKNNVDSVVRLIYSALANI